ncbi:unnamed protein product [Rotaria magnacalcarata]|uniref:Uncharacterized protein n=2 Tax=Rotaria magnacalcarata TaxID=392030 RepID=A0A819QNQ7_9BILA|nr:unnamed protein product [Rotaria magnacalcarata]CAF4033989.1 unnamed protein product [Rotaria magnacalcarata]
MQIQGRSMSSQAAMRQLAQSLNVHVPDNWSDLMKPPNTTGVIGEVEVGSSNLESEVNGWSLPGSFRTEVLESVRTLMLGAVEGSYSAQTYTFDAGSTTTLSTLLVVITKLLSPSNPDQPYGLMHAAINGNALVKQQYTTYSVKVCKYCTSHFWKAKGCCHQEAHSSPRGHSTEELNNVRQKMIADQYAWFSQQNLASRRSSTLVKIFIPNSYDSITETLENLLSRKEVKNEMVMSYNDSILTAIQSNFASLKLSTHIFKMNKVSKKNMPRLFTALAKQHGFGDFYSNSEYSQQIALPTFSYETLFTSQNVSDLSNVFVKYVWILGQTTDNLTYALNVISLTHSSSILIEKIPSNATRNTVPSTTVEKYNQLNISRLSTFNSDGQFSNQSLLTLSSPWEQKTTRTLLNMLRFIAASAIVPQQFRMLSDFNVEVTRPQPNFNLSIQNKGRTIALQIQALATAVSSAAKAVGDVITVLKSSKTVTIERILRFGFSYFNQRSRILRAMNVPSSRTEAFMHAVAQDYALPKTDSFLMGVTYSDDFSWEQVQYLYSPAKNGVYRCLTLFKTGDSTTDTASFFIVDINSDYHIAPDLLLVTTSKSRLGGLFSSSKQSIQEVPHVLTLDEAVKLQQFFMLVAIGNMAQTLRVTTDFSAVHK